MVGVGLYLGWGHTLTFHGLNKIQKIMLSKKQHKKSLFMLVNTGTGIKRLHTKFYFAGDFVGSADGRGLSPLEASAGS